MLNRAANNRQKFKNFDDMEFLNLLFQTLCFLLETSIKRKKCFKSDIRLFIGELNEKIYKKDLTFEEIDELTDYVIQGLANGGKAYIFEYPVFELGEIQHKPIQLIEVNGEDKLLFSLTMQGYHFILATKEYDELLQIHLSQMLARIRLSRDDYEGALGSVGDILNNLEIQKQKIDLFIKKIRSDVREIKNQSYVKVVNETYQMLQEEMDKYDELKKEALSKQQDRENYLNSNKTLSPDNEKSIRKKLLQLHELIVKINEVKDSSSRLLTRVQKFHDEHSSILRQLLTTRVVKKFNFKEEIQDKLEENVNNLDAIQKLYASLFNPRLGNIFEVNIPYKEQKILGIKGDSGDRHIVDEADTTAVEDEEANRRIEEHEKQHLHFFKLLLAYAKTKNEFTLKEFFKDCIDNNKDAYLAITKDAYTLRNMVLYFAGLQNAITVDDILLVLNKGSFHRDIEFQIERVYEQILNNDKALIMDFQEFETQQLCDDVFNLNTEIDLEKLTAKSIEMTNIKFRFLFKKEGDFDDYYS